MSEIIRPLAAAADGVAAQQAQCRADCPETESGPFFASGDALPIARDQEVLQLHYDEEPSHTEIGTILGCSSRNVAVRLHRALQRLRQQVESIAGDVTGAEELALQTAVDLSSLHRTITVPLSLNLAVSDWV